MLLADGVLLCIIVMDKNLHRPMFILVCNLVVCDLLGATAVLPSLMMHFLMGQKKITFIPALAQAFSVHMYGVAVQTPLGVMADDRYRAIMTWFIAVLLIFVLFILHMNSPLCGNTTQHVYCSNRAILNLACSPTPINNIDGLSIFWTVNTSIFLIIAFSYFRILHTCVKQGRAGSGVRSKTFQTCAPHLIIFGLYQIAIMVIVVSHRFPSLSPNIKKFVSILFIIIPPPINPIIYGLVSKEIRHSIIKHLIRLHVHQKHSRGLTS